MCIPENGQQRLTFPQASTSYISRPPLSSPYLPDGVQCSQKFSLVGDDRPQELTIDEETGILSMFVDSTVKRSYLIDVQIVTSDGTNDDIKMV